MSHAPTDDAEGVSSEAIRAGRAMSQMVLEGRALSGRERNCCFLNTGPTPAAGGRFANISAVSGLDFPDDGRAVALVDWDHDGDQDLWISNRNAPRLRLMRNDLPAGNHFLAMRLQGDGKTTNRDAIGARVEVVLKNPQSAIGVPAPVGHPQSIKTLRAGEGYLAQASKWLHFGLGAADAIDKVIVHWPGGQAEQFSDLQVDRRYRLVQGSRQAVDVTGPARTTTLAAAIQTARPSSQVARVPMVETVTVPPVPYRTFDGQPRTLPAPTDDLLLVNLWASWCAPCLTELSELARRHDEIRAKGIRVLALSVDALGDDPAAVQSAAGLVSGQNFPFEVGLATLEVTEQLQDLHDYQFALNRPLPLPSSFLIDRRGRLAVIYKGPLSVDQLLEDTDHSEAGRQQRWSRSAPLVGRPVGHPRTEQTSLDWAATLRFRIAHDLQQTGRLDQAAAQYADVLEFHPDSFEVRNTMGLALKKMGKIDEAMVHYRESLRIEPDYAEAHNNLANVLRTKGRLNEAVTHYEAALSSQPDTAKVNYNLGSTLLKLGRIDEAAARFREALRLDPDFLEAHVQMGNVLSITGRPAEAVERYEDALRIRPDMVEAHLRLGSLLDGLGRFKEALSHYDEAAKLNPKNVPAINDLAWLLATCPTAEVRDGKRALQLAGRLAEVPLDRPGSFTILDTIAAAHAEAGYFEQAVEWQEKAIRKAPPQQQQQLRERLELYQQGKPFRQPPAAEESVPTGGAPKARPEP